MQADGIFFACACPTHRRDMAYLPGARAVSTTVEASALSIQASGFDVASANEFNWNLTLITLITLDKDLLPKRLKMLFDGIREVVARYEPDASSIEIVFVNVNPQSTLLLGQARGAAITALVFSDLPVSQYTALKMKQAVVGWGRASKDQIQEMVKRLLNLPSLPGPDAADALGLAITHAHKAMARLALADGVIDAGKGKYKAGRSR